MAKLLPCAAVSLLLALLSSSEPVASSSVRVRRYDSIFSFGDSFADTGNNPVVFRRCSVSDAATRPPYGSTFFGRPTGRNCDGRLIIDFLAERLGLPLVPPFLAHNGSFRRGANFAVGAATALDAGVFHHGEPPGASQFPLNTSLDVQLQWFESLKPSLCATAKECKQFFRTSLFFVGEFGFNDYSFLLLRKSIQQVRSIVPDVIRTISMAIERLIKHGATSLVVPGMYPFGCSPLFLVKSDDGDPARYDSRAGCLNDMNELATRHNSLLLESLEKIRAEHPGVEVTYADFFSPVKEMVESPSKFGPKSSRKVTELGVAGFEGDVLTVCCGGPGRYHCNVEVLVQRSSCDHMQGSICSFVLGWHPLDGGGIPIRRR
ncbi:hypothetical protein ACP70R_030896 [Stipagrostis hirtigluma subsp. patula]